MRGVSVLSKPTTQRQFTLDLYLPQILLTIHVFVLFGEKSAQKIYM